MGRVRKSAKSGPDAGALLTPKELAAAIGVSESSLRRWVDRGHIPMTRTTGGHRRISLAAAVRFIRETGATVVRPELLGFQPLPTTRRGGAKDAPKPMASTSPTRGRQGDDNAAAAATPEPGDALFQALHAGDRDVARGLIQSAYLKGRGLPALFDGPVRTAMRRLGELWAHDPRGILIEHRGTDICVAAVTRLRELLPAPGERAPFALGGAPQDDPYQLPTLMAGLICAEAGFRDVNFGANTPIELLGDEAVERGARLVWLSVSAAREPRVLRVAIERLAATLVKRRIQLVVGGLHAADCAPRGLANVTQIASMGELAAFARGLHTRRPAAREK